MFAPEKDAEAVASTQSRPGTPIPVPVIGDLGTKKDQPPISTDDASSTPTRADQFGEVLVATDEASARQKRQDPHEDAFDAEAPAEADVPGDIESNVVPKKQKTTFDAVTT
jgi:hypothetical protein